MAFGRVGQPKLFAGGEDRQRGRRGEGQTLAIQAHQEVRREMVRQRQTPQDPRLLAAEKLGRAEGG